MNRDTLYSTGSFVLTEPVTLLKPDSAGRFQSMMVNNQDHSMLPIKHGPGEFTLTRSKDGTRHAKVNPIGYLLGTAYGWGGNPEGAAIVNVYDKTGLGMTDHKPQ